ncbi:hypothetical protein HNQ93_003472 [Hymenobacter luteus]|uniref:Uncharacterized protein n=2 Tax=Hymenobacter TaxID=89966 RepID=A0A7W9T3X7_9BACT|nr:MULTISPECIES: hypothetical protein [Hymenobacter]MBB4602707.1 hypothetical protein [Hymenobacter latericoloratus]MBB6060598.1 hypothetical protein [Hymenobacter luteus]
MIVRCPNSKWNWSKEKIKIILGHKPISLTWIGNEKSIHFYNEECIEININIDKNGNHIKYSFHTYTPKRWRNKFMYDRAIASEIEHGSVLSKHHDMYVNTQPFNCEWLKNQAIDELDEGFLILSCEETKELLRYNGIEKVENITLSLVVNHPKFTTLEREFLDLLY